MSAKKIKVNKLYQTVVNAINNKEKVSPHLNKKWIPILNSDKYFMWTFWKEDCLSIEKSLTFHKDLKVEVVMVFNQAFSR